jgi:hypothetical protein
MTTAGSRRGRRAQRAQPSVPDLARKENDGLTRAKQHTCARGSSIGLKEKDV